MSNPFCRFKRLGYVVLSVTDLERSTRFYQHTVGLELASQESGESRLTCSKDAYSIVLKHGATPGLVRIAFEVESSEDLKRAASQFERIGHPFDEVGAPELAALGVGRAIRTEVPGCGVVMELYEGQPLRGVDFQPTVADIVRLGHLVIKTDQFDTAHEFFTRVLNFRVSDRIKSEDGGPHEVAFMRCFPNPYHHSIGLARANKTGLHHVALMVGRIDDIGAALNRFKRAGAKIVFGPGRHTASGSVFLYFLDPDGMTVEYTFGMEEFSEEEPRDARKLLPLPETVDLWGGQPTPDYATVGVILKN